MTFRALFIGEALRRGVLAAASWTLAAVALLLLPLPLPTAARDLPDFVELVEQVGPAVVNIRTTERAADEPAVPSSSRPRPPVPGRRGEGSGFIISSDGYVITNAHVVEGVSEVLVTLTDRREFKARIVGADERTDVALVKIEATALPVLKIGDVGRLRVGEWVLAIGSPFGLENTVTAGIVSAKQRETGSDVPFIQTDVAVNPGNSGGPLISIRGEVVGVNSQILSPVGSYIGISFAIPIDEAMRVADQLRASGRVVRGYLGIGPVDVPRELAEEYGLAPGPGRPKGALVRQIVPGTPAERAGVQPGDVVLAVNGRAIDQSGDLPAMVGLAQPGDPIDIDVWRQGARHTLHARLDDAKPRAVKTPEAGTPNAKGRLGLAMRPLQADEKRQSGIASGLLIERVSGAAERAGVRAGDVLLAIDGRPVTSLAEASTAVARSDKSMALLVQRGELKIYVPVRLV